MPGVVEASTAAAGSAGRSLQPVVLPVWRVCLVSDALLDRLLMLRWKDIWCTRAGLPTSAQGVLQLRLQHLLWVDQQADVLCSGAVLSQESAVSLNDNNVNVCYSCML